ncbi:hypothetical protein [Streptomyces sp. NPDC004435]
MPETGAGVDPDSRTVTVPDSRTGTDPDSRTGAATGTFADAAPHPP